MDKQGRKAGGVTGRTLTFLEATYESISCEVRIGKELSEPFEVSRGLRQGCVLSPLLLFLYIKQFGGEGEKQRGRGEVSWETDTRASVCR